MLISTQLHSSLEAPVLDSLNFLNEIMGQYPNAISFAPGAPNLAHLTDIDISQYVDLYMHHLCHHNNISLDEAKHLLYQYGPAQGLINDLVATSIQKDKGFNASPGSLVITVGAQEAMFIVLRALFRSPNYQLAVVNPCFVGILGAAKLLDIEMLSIDETEHGIDLEQLDKACVMACRNNHAVRALYVAPDYSNPAGTVLTLDARIKLLELAKRHDILLLEDNAYGFTAQDDRIMPTLKSLDTTGHVIFIGTFAKICLPGARVGYVVADQVIQTNSQSTHMLAKDLATIKSMITVNTSPICQAIIGGMLLEQKGSFKSLERKRSIIYKNNLVLLLDALKRQIPSEQCLDIQWNQPTGGFFVRVRLPILTNLALLEYSASHFGVLWTPMSFFYLNNTGNNELRLSCSYLTPEQIEEGVERLGRFFRSVILRKNTDAKS